MNRAERRAKKKKAAADAVAYVTDPNTWTYVPTAYEPPKPPVLGVDCPPEIPEFSEMVNRNQWHDKKELDSFIETIKKLAVSITDMFEEDGDTLKSGVEDWSWTRNWDCKYINLRIDMRDGGFILTNDKKQRINLEQLRWQYGKNK
jgi:hypothetical protein